MCFFLYLDFNRKGIMEFSFVPTNGIMRYCIEKYYDAYRIGIYQHLDDAHFSFSGIRCKRIGLVSDAYVHYGPITDEMEIELDIPEQIWTQVHSIGKQCVQFAFDTVKSIPLKQAIHNEGGCFFQIDRFRGDERLFICKVKRLDGVFGREEYEEQMYLGLEEDIPNCECRRSRFVELPSFLDDPTYEIEESVYNQIKTSIKNTTLAARQILESEYYARKQND